jgi:chromosome partitioning protein
MNNDNSLVRFEMDVAKKTQLILSKDLKDKKKEIKFKTASEMSGMLKMTSSEIKDEISRGNMISLKHGNKTVIPQNIQEINTLMNIYEDNKKEDAYTISVMNGKGGVLKTANTSNIGASIAFLGKKVLLIDGDVTQCSLSSHFKAENEDMTKFLTPIIIDIQNGQLANDDIKQRVKESIYNIDTSKRFKQGKLDILPSDKRLKELTKVISTSGRHINALRKIIDSIRDEYDFILIDTPPSTVSPIIDLSIFASDFVLLSLLAEPETLDTATEIINPIIEINDAYGKNCGIVGAIYGRYIKQMNLYSSALKETTEYLSENIGMSFMVETVAHAPTIALGQYGSGASIMFQPTSKTTSEYIDIAIQTMMYSVFLGEE